MQIPALTDKSSDGSTIRLFESGSIMQYLVDKYDPDHKVSYPFGSKEYYETNNWVSLRTLGGGASTVKLTASNSSTGRWEDVRINPSLYHSRRDRY